MEGKKRRGQENSSFAIAELVLGNREDDGSKTLPKVFKAPEKLQSR